MPEAVKPTPVPYAVGKNGFENYVITNGLDKIIASLNPMGSLTEEESKATAEFVVFACNAYADMLEALRACDWLLRNLHAKTNNVAAQEDIKECAETIRTTLEKALTQ